MTDVFISYAREDQPSARMLATEVIRLGYTVWWDEELPAHVRYGDVIAERIGTAKAVIVIWSRHSVGSEWVRAEADRGREARKLVQTALDPTPPPMPFNQFQVASLADWQGQPDHSGWRRVIDSLAALVPNRFAPPPKATATAAPLPRAAAPTASSPPVAAVSARGEHDDDRGAFDRSRPAHRLCHRHDDGAGPVGTGTAGPAGEARAAAAGTDAAVPDPRG